MLDEVLWSWKETNFDSFTNLYIFSLLHCKNVFLRVPSSGICHVVPWKSTDVSEEYIASIFRLCLPLAFKVDSYSAYSSILKMEVICSSETSVDFQRTTWLYIPEGRTLHNQGCANLKSYMRFVVCRLFLCLCVFIQYVDVRLGSMWRFQRILFSVQDFSCPRLVPSESEYSSSRTRGPSVGSPKHKIGISSQTALTFWLGTFHSFMEIILLNKTAQMVSSCSLEYSHYGLKDEMLI
jgi:hypothetical protein